MIKRAWDVNTTDQGGNSLLMLAARGRPGGSRRRIAGRGFQSRCAQRLGRNGGVDVKRIGRASRSSQETASPRGQSQSARLDALDVCGGERRKSEISRLLIANGAQVNATAVNGYTALMMAAREGRREVVSLLLANGADPKLETGCRL